MFQRPVLESVLSSMRLSFNIKNVDNLFPGFILGDFAVLHGSSAVSFLSSFLSVKAQLPYQLGGLETNVLFVDGGNTFRLYDVSTIAQIYELDPRKILEKIFVSRAFTAYQLTSIIFDRLEDVVERYDANLILLSDIARLYLDKDVPKKEAKEIFSQLASYLSKFAKENRVIVVATYPPKPRSKRNMFFKEMICGRANVVASVKPSQHGQQFVLEKHPFFALGKTEFPSGNLTLMDFVEA